MHYRISWQWMLHEEVRHNLKAQILEVGISIAYKAGEREEVWTNKQADLSIL